MPDPVRVIPLSYAQPATSRRHWPFLAKMSLGLGAICCVIAWVLIQAVDVESVIATGPILFTLGLIALIGGILLRHWWVAMIGGSHCGICLLFVGLVNLLHWSPSVARKPFVVMGLGYCLISVPFTVVMLIWDPPTTPPATFDSTPPPGHK